MGNVLGDPFKKVKKKKSSAVVAIHANYPRNYGMSPASTSSATGFVVNKDLGIILTNKHVVTEGPVRAKAEFKANEEIDLVPLYTDPVHDFGFFKFDPSKLKDTPPTEIKLNPEGAKAGTVALVIGNNGGQDLSYVETIIAQTNRPAPSLLDMNTFYIASSDTGVSGSSGSPLLNLKGEAIALAAAGDPEMFISLALPLYRIQRALEYLERGEAVPRGTIQVGFKHVNFERLMKTGQMQEHVIGPITEKLPDDEGMLVVEKCIPEGPGSKAGVLNGDILLKVNDSLVTNFVTLEGTLDTYIGQNIKLIVVRQGEEKEITCIVQDFDELRKSEYVEISDAIVHRMQYNLAVFLNLPLKGLLLAKPGYMFAPVPAFSIILKVDGKETNSPEEFVESLKVLSHSALVPVKYQPLDDPTKTVISTCIVDKKWFPFQIVNRKEGQGNWNYTTFRSDENVLDHAVVPSTLKVDDGVDKQTASEKTGRKRFSLSPKEYEKLIPKAMFSRAWVSIGYEAPYSIDGFEKFMMTNGQGLILDADLGIVVTNSDFLRHSLVDLRITFEFVLTISAKVFFIDPVNEIAYLQYDPEEVFSKSKRSSSVTVKPISLNLFEGKPNIGEELSTVNWGEDGAVVVRQATVARTEDFYFTSDFIGHIRSAWPFEIMVVAESGGPGIYLNSSNEVVSFCFIGRRLQFGMDLLSSFQVVRKSIENGDRSFLPRFIKLLPITFKFCDFAKAKSSFGLPDYWEEKLLQTVTIHQKKVLVVGRRMVSHDVYLKLKENDIILSIEEKPVTLVREYYNLTINKEKVKMNILREGEVLEVTCKTENYSTFGTSRIVQFAGLTFQEIPDSVKYLCKPQVLEQGGVYVCNKLPGSPADAAEAEAAEQDISTTASIDRKIVFKVGNSDVHNLDELLNAVEKYGHEDHVTLLAQEFTLGERSSHSIKLDLEYWKTKEVVLGIDGEWKTILKKANANNV
eukprot:maker-scaffold_4-snap-gene-9.63-mRNA-1 protein AED:0.31 eAED:0.31 QI:0/0/0/1/1/1/2/0/967